MDTKTILSLSRPSPDDSSRLPTTLGPRGPDDESGCELGPYIAISLLTGPTGRSKSRPKSDFALRGRTPAGAAQPCPVGDLDASGSMPVVAVKGPAADPRSAAGRRRTVHGILWSRQSQFGCVVCPSSRVLFTWLCVLPKLFLRPHGESPPQGCLC